MKQTFKEKLECDWKMDEMAHLIGLIENMVLKSDTEDTRRWILSHSRVFSVKSCIYLGKVIPPHIFGRSYGI